MDFEGRNNRLKGTKKSKNVFVTPSKGWQFGVKHQKPKTTMKMKKLIIQCTLSFILSLLLFSNSTQAQCDPISGMDITDETPLAYQFSWIAPVNALGYGVQVNNPDGSSVYSVITISTSVWLSKSMLNNAATISVTTNCGPGQTSTTYTMPTVLEVEIIYGRCMGNQIHPEIEYQINQTDLYGIWFGGDCICGFVDKVVDYRVICRIREYYPDNNQNVIEHFETKGCFLSYCTVSNSLLPTIEFGLGKNEGQLASTEIDLNCYPNPAESELNLAWENSENESVAIEILSLDGRKFFETESTESRTTINHIESWPSGLYLVVIKKGDQTERLKIMITDN